MRKLLLSLYRSPSIYWENFHRSCDETKAGESEKTKVEKKEEVKTERLTTGKTSGRKRSQDRERDRSRESQSVRERHKRGERSRGGDRAAFKGSIYRPRSRPECRVHISNIPYEYRWQDLKDLFRSEGQSLYLIKSVTVYVIVQHNSGLLRILIVI